MIKNSDKEKHVHSGYGMAFDSAGSWSFDNDFTRNVIIFCIDKNSSSLCGNRRNNSLVLG